MRVQAPEFEREWLEASDADALRRIVLRAPRHRLKVAGS